MSGYFSEGWKLLTTWWRQLCSKNFRMVFSPRVWLSSVQPLSCVQLFATPHTAAGQASLSITNSWSLPKLLSMMPSNHLILCRPLLLLPSVFPSTRVFPNESVLHIRWPKYWNFSLSISSSTEHSDWSPLGWTGWTSPLDSQESSPTPQFKSINSPVLSFLYSPTLASIHDYWKNHSLDQMDLCWQSNVSAF